MAIVTIQEAQATLPDLIHKLAPGVEVVITENDLPLAKLVRVNSVVRQRPQPGLGKGMLTILVEDDEHLEHFKDYMP